MNCLSCNTKLSWNGPKRLKQDNTEEDLCFTCLRVAMLAADDEDHLFFEREYMHSHITEALPVVVTEDDDYFSQ